MASGKRQLEQLFRECDKNGTGHIGPQEFRDLCTGFDIDPADSDTIFDDLDHDGDGKVSLEDFAWGFRDFLSPDQGGSRRVSVDVLETVSWEALERKHSMARRAWSNLVASVGLPTISQFLNTSGPKFAELYEELQAPEICPQLVKHFEHAFSSLLQDVKKLHEDNKKMEEMFLREKESHLAHLQSLEEELDTQVARVEQQVRDEARKKYEAEKFALQERMEAEIAELQTHLRLFQKVNDALSRNSVESHTSDNRHETTMENRQLRQMLADTRTNLAILRSEMAHLKSDYDNKCRQLREQEETVSGYAEQNDQVHRQLELLHEANSRMQDTNDSLLSVLEQPQPRSPRPLSPCCYSHACPAASPAASPAHSPAPSPKRWWLPGSGPPSDTSNANVSAPNSLDPIHSSARCDAQFGVHQFTEDLDSGRSTMRKHHDGDSDRSLHNELLLATSTIAMHTNTRHYSQPRKIPAAETSTPTIPTIAVTMAQLEPTGPPDRTFKIILAGDAAVGKSCFIFRFCKGVFLTKLGSTLGVDFQVKTIRVDNRNVTLQLWDTAGQERFRSMTKAYFRRADGVILLYDVTNERSFLNVRLWVQGIEEVAERALPIILCGNKTDMRDESRTKGISCIETQHGNKLAQEHRALFTETSSKTGENILSAVLVLVREMLTQEDTEVQTSAMKITDDTKAFPCCSAKK